MREVTCSGDAGSQTSGRPPTWRRCHERRSCQEVALHLAYHWFCKLDLDDKVSHHSTSSAASWEWRCWLRMFGCGKTLSGEMPVSRLRRRSLPARRLTSLWANKEVPYAKPSGAGKKERNTSRKKRPRHPWAGKGQYAGAASMRSLARTSGAKL